VVDYWRVLGPAPGAEEAFTNRLNEVRIISLISYACVNRIYSNQTHQFWLTFGISFSVARWPRLCSAFVQRFSPLFVHRIQTMISWR
jgi:hypothetical protein